MGRIQNKELLGLILQDNCDMVVKNMYSRNKITKVQEEKKDTGKKQQEFLVPRVNQLI